MGYPSWSDGVATVVFPVGAETPLEPVIPTPQQVYQAASDQSLQVAEVAGTVYEYPRTYRGLPLATYQAFLAFLERPSVRFGGFPVTHVDEDGTSLSVRLTSVRFPRRNPNGTCDIELTMRKEMP